MLGAAIYCLSATNVFAYSYTLKNCPNSGKYVNEDYNYSKAIANHRYYPGDNYKAIADTSGGRYVIWRESWNCKLCGTFITKDTVLDVSTPKKIEEKQKEISLLAEKQEENCLLAEKK